MVVSLHPLSPKKRVLKKSEENIEILEHEIACVKSHIYKMCDTTQMSSRLEESGSNSVSPKIKILTMKSLILAQDER